VLDDIAFTGVVGEICGNIKRFDAVDITEATAGNQRAHIQIFVAKAWEFAETAVLLDVDRLGNDLSNSQFRPANNPIGILLSQRGSSSRDSVRGVLAKTAVGQRRCRCFTD